MPISLNRYLSAVFACSSAKSVFIYVQNIVIGTERNAELRMLLPVTHQPISLVRNVDRIAFIRHIKMFLILFVLFVAVVYLYLRHVYSYWSRHGFPHLTPSIPLGNLQLVATRKTSFGVCLHELYKSSSAPFVGIYMLFKPVLLVRDATLARNILAADFNSFHDRGIYCNPQYDPLSENLFAMEGHRWRALRSKLTPTFTSGKLRNMMSTIAIESDRLQAYLVDYAAGEQVVEMKDLLSRYLCAEAFDQCTLTRQPIASCEQA